MSKRQSSGNPAVAIGYLRVSTEDQNLGPRAQARAIEEWAGREGVALVAVFIDHGVSGGTPMSARPGLVAAMAALTDLGAGVLVAQKRDRIARDVEVARTIERQAGKAGADVRTADGMSDARGSQGVLQRGVPDLFAEYERAVISERTKAALAVLKASGKRLGSIPYGYTADADKRLVAHEAEQAVIRLVRELRAGKVSTHGIARELNARCVASRSGRAWVQTQIVRILRDNVADAA